MKQLFLLTALFLNLYAGNGQAAAPRWTYVDILYQTADSGEDKTNGAGIRVVANFVSIWHAGAGYSRTRVDGGRNKGTPPAVGSDLSSVRFYIGMHPKASDSTDAVFELGYFDATRKRRNPANEMVEDREDGLFARAGVRSMVSDKFELNGYVVAEDRETAFANGVTTSRYDQGVQAGGQYYFTPDFSLGLDAVTGIGTDKLDIFIRWNF